MNYRHGPQLKDPLFVGGSGVEKTTFACRHGPQLKSPLFVGGSGVEKTTFAYRHGPQLKDSLFVGGPGVRKLHLPIVGAMIKYVLFWEGYSNSKAIFQPKP